MEAHDSRVTQLEPPDSGENSQAEGPAVAAKDLVQLAELLRRAVASIDAEARERLEAAWVALTSALKQPQQDAARITARLRRLRGEIDRILAGQQSGTTGDDGAPAPKAGPKD